MADYDDQYMQSSTRAGTDVVNAGLRSYMLKVYNYMGLGVAFTAVITLFMAANPALMQTVAMGGMKWVLFLGVLGLGWFAPRLILTGSSATAQISFWIRSNRG